MISTDTHLLKIIHDTKAVSIWNRKTGPVFWYAANVPGPFYVNTELVIGPTLAEKLLNKITEIVASTTDLAQRAQELNKIILQAYAENPMYQQIIAAMVAAAQKEFPAGTYALVSGGERRDWLFSIPFAKEIGIKHAFLFKNHGIYCEQPLVAGEKALHIADLINNAASYFETWFPILDKAQLPCAGTLCVNSRGTNGVKRLRDHGQKVVPLNSIDIGFFERSVADGLIDAGTLAEITTYFSSPQKWAADYLLKDVALFDAANIDKKSFERLRFFFTKDPWSLRAEHPAFFEAMETAIRERDKAAA